MASAEHGANGKPVVAVVVVRVLVFRVEVEVTRVVRVRLVERRRPVVAVRGLVVHVRAVAVACGGQENGVLVFCGGSLLHAMGGGVFMFSPTEGGGKKRRPRPIPSRPCGFIAYSSRLVRFFPPHRACVAGPAASEIAISGLTACILV